MIFINNQNFILARQYFLAMCPNISLFYKVNYQDTPEPLLTVEVKKQLSPGTINYFFIRLFLYSSHFEEGTNEMKGHELWYNPISQPARLVRY